MAIFSEFLNFFFYYFQSAFFCCYCCFSYALPIFLLRICVDLKKKEENITVLDIIHIQFYDSFPYIFLELIVSFKYISCAKRHEGDIKKSKSPIQIFFSCCYIRIFFYSGPHTDIESSMLMHHLRCASCHCQLKWNIFLLIAVKRKIGIKNQKKLRKLTHKYNQRISICGCSCARTHVKVTTTNRLNTLTINPRCTFRRFWHFHSLRKIFIPFLGEWLRNRTETAATAKKIP